MKPLVIRYGLVAGVIVSAFMFASLWFVDSNTDMSGGELIGFAGMFIAFSSIFFGVRKYRDKHLDGEIHFGKAFLIGLYIALIASTLYVISWMILSETVFTEFGDQYFDQQIELVKQKQLSEIEMQEEIQDMKEFKEAYKNPIFKFFITYAEILPIGLLVALITALILKRKKVKA